MWPFLLTRSLSFSRTIDASLDTVLQLVRDPNVLLRLSPLVMDVSIDPSNSTTYTITERLDVLGYFRTQTTFKVTLTLQEDGVDSEVLANAGTKSKSCYRVKVGEDGKTTVTEQVTIQVIEIS